MKDIQGRIKMTLEWFVAVGREKGMDWSKVGSRGLSEPSDGSNNALILPFLFKESRIRVVLV